MIAFVVSMDYDNNMFNDGEIMSSASSLSYQDVISMYQSVLRTCWYGTSSTCTVIHTVLFSTYDDEYYYLTQQQTI